MRVLAGDIGGTWARLGLFEAGGGVLARVRSEVLSSPEFDGLPALVRRFLRGDESQVDRACLALACPIVGEVLEPPNLPWKVEIAGLASALGLPAVALLNDMEALGHALPFLGPEDIRVLKDGVAEPSGTVALLAPGTGLGEGYASRRQGRYLVHPSEGGHVDFAPRTEEEMELLRFLLRRYDHVSYERILSGPGIVSLYGFARDRGADSAPDAEEAVAATGAAAVLSQAGQGDGACVRAVDLFTRILGAEAGNLALKVLATGGVYVGGGIVTRVADDLACPAFREAFVAKGRYRKFLEAIPVTLITGPDVGLMGAARYAVM